jgi:conjugative relaxase-like TrwC/TraI family protein
MVASVSACTGPDYYLETDQALYYLTGDAGAGVWFGEGAAALGFRGSVFSEHLIAAFAGLGPDGVTRLIQLPKGRNHQPAWDITFSAPKSVSVLWSVLGPDDRHKIETLVMMAAKRAIRYLDDKALLSRRGKGGKSVEHAKGVYALCPHGTSRSQDPQLHVHSLAINLCVREDGSTGTIRSKDLYQHKMAAGAVFRLELASLLARRLGLKIEADKWSFKVAGVPQSLCDEQSKRRQVIEQIAKEEGWFSPKVLAQLAITTRNAKGAVSIAECTTQWLAAGERHSFGRGEAAELLAAAADTIGEGLASRLMEDARNHGLRDALDRSIGSLSSSQAYFAERDLLQQVAVELQASGLDADDVIDAVDDELDGFQSSVALPGVHCRYYATEETLASERELIAIAERRRSDSTHPVSDAAVSKAKKTVEQSLSQAIASAAELTFDQHTALLHITQEAGGTKLIQGYAGTGKTQMLEAANLAWRASGYEVLGTALSGKAAAGLETATGVRSVTISKLMLSLLPEITNAELQKAFPANAAACQGAYFEGYRTKAWMKNPLGEALKELERDYQRHQAAPELQLTSKTILVVDEAGMVPTKLMLRLLQECDKAGAKLVLIGDKLQLPAIEAGGPFVSLCDRLGSQDLTTIVRQRQEWMRDASYALIQNDPRLALDLYAENDSLRIANSHKAAVAHLVADYGKLSAVEYKTSLALTSTRAEASQINAGVQQRRLAAGQLQGESASLKNGERVYEQDRVLLTRNDYWIGSRNGMLGTVVAVEQPQWRGDAVKLKIQLDSPTSQKGTSQKVSSIVLDLAKYSDLQLGYAVTTHKAQGATVKSSFVLLGESMLNKEMAFTQLTRASHETTIYSARAQLGNTMESLAGRLSVSAAKGLASDHRVRVRSRKAIEKRQGLLREVLKALSPETAQELLPPTAYLGDARFGGSQTGAMWQLIGEYSKLSKEDYEKTIAVVTDTFEASRINQGVQNHRRGAHELGVDSIKIRQGEQIHRGDRVLVFVTDEQGASVARLGKAIEFSSPFAAVMKPDGETVVTQTKQWLTIELDPEHQQGRDAAKKERITVEAKDFDKVTLGYAATTAQLKGVKMESSLVLLPEKGQTSEDIAVQLTSGAKDVSIFAERSYYEPRLDAGKGLGEFARSLDAATTEVQQEKTQSMLERYGQLADEQKKQREQSEQAQLSRQQSLGL